MNVAARQAYTKVVRAILVFVLLSIATTGMALAAPVLVDAGSAPVVSVQLLTGRLTVRTWDRPQVQIDTQGTVDWFHATPRQVESALPPTQRVLAQTANTPTGKVSLPPEEFVMPPLAPGQHQGVRIHGDGATTVTIPQGTVLVLAQVGFGSIVVEGYHDGAFFAVVHAGAIVLKDVSGTGFAQAVKGQVRIGASSFARIRVRTGTGNVLFENCTAEQIEVTSIRGSIAYDNGSFSPGLARFESQSGNIALGIGSGGAQVDAHGAHVYTDFSGHSSISSNGVVARGAIGNGGPAVTASAANGTLLLYDGALRNHPSLASNVPEMHAILTTSPAAFNRPATKRIFRPRHRAKKPPR